MNNIYDPNKTLTRLSSDKYEKNGAIDEDLLLKDLLNIKSNLDKFMREINDLYRTLNSAQKTLQSYDSNGYKINKSKPLSVIISDVMSVKQEIEKINDSNIYPLIYFAEKADHLRMLKDEIAKDEYLKAEWNKLLMYMRMKEK